MLLRIADGMKYEVLLLQGEMLKCIEKSEI